MREAALAARGLDPEEIIAADRLSDEMKAWVRERVPPGRDPIERLRGLLRALLQREPSIKYDADHTGTAQEVFEAARANCLSFTLLFVGMARELGIDAYYLGVERRQRFEQEGDLVVLWEHVTAAYGPPSRRTVLEFPIGEPIESHSGTRLSDLTALAMFYSNRGAERLRRGADAEAVEWLVTATRLDPDWSHAWLNLGVARRRLGELEAAEAAYRRAIASDADHLQAYLNLSSLMRFRGEEDAAREVLGLLAQRPGRDPFIHLALGDTSLEEGRLEEAHDYYRRARRLAPDEPAPRAAMGLSALAAGRVDEAREWLERAERLDTEGDPRVERLRRELSKRSGDPG